LSYNIRWVIERRLKNGDWAAVISDQRRLDISSERPYLGDALRGATALSASHPALFSELSGVGHFSTDGPIATPELPSDAAPYTRDYLDGDQQAIQGYSTLKPKPFTDQGYIEWGLFSSISNYRQRIYLDTVFRYIQTMEPLLGREILFGAVRMNETPRHPDMAAASNHRRLKAQACLADLLPIANDTARLCLAYQY
jgi:hypothetical protein